MTLNYKESFLFLLFFQRKTNLLSAYKIIILALLLNTAFLRVKSWQKRTHMYNIVYIFDFARSRDK